MIEFIKSIGTEILKYFKIIVSIIIFIYVVRFLGVRGMIGFLIGLIFMGVLVISGNPIFLNFVEMLSTQRKEKVKYIKRKWL